MSETHYCSRDGTFDSTSSKVVQSSMEQGRGAEVGFLASFALATKKLDFTQHISDFKVCLLEAKRELPSDTSPLVP